MWSPIAAEMKIPWRTAESMHWQLGEEDMARRAGVVSFSLSSVALDIVDAPPLGKSSANPDENSRSTLLANNRKQRIDR